MKLTSLKILTTVALTMMIVNPHSAIGQTGCVKAPTSSGACGPVMDNGPLGNPPCTRIKCAIDEHCTGGATWIMCTDSPFTAVCVKEVGTIFYVPFANCGMYMFAGTVPGTACRVITGTLGGCGG